MATFDDTRGYGLNGLNHGYQMLSKVFRVNLWIFWSSRSTLTHSSQLAGVVEQRSRAQRNFVIFGYIIGDMSGFTIKHGERNGGSTVSPIEDLQPFSNMGFNP